MPKKTIKKKTLPSLKKKKLPVAKKKKLPTPPTKKKPSLFGQPFECVLVENVNGLMMTFTKGGFKMVVAGAAAMEWKGKVSKGKTYIVTFEEQ